MKCIQKTEHQKNLPVIQYNQDYHKVWNADKDRVLVIAENLDIDYPDLDLLTRGEI